MQICALDPSDRDTMAAWHATFAAAHSDGLEHATPRMLEEMRAELLGSSPGDRLAAYAGYVDGALVVTGMLVLPLKDNLHLAFVDVATQPARRRQGHGTAMLRHLSDLAVTAGRRTLATDAEWPYDEPADGAGTPSGEFLTRHGFRCALGDVKRALDLPADEALLSRLIEDAAPYHSDYTVRQFRGAVPGDLVDSFGNLIGSLMSEAPMGELELEPEVFDAERIRAEEQVFEASGRTKYTTVALGPAGDVVAYSEVMVPRHDPGRVYQWGTLVRPAHRGHRLGTATKAHNLRFLQAEVTDRTVLYTYNAEVNRHMVAVNDALGFRPVGRLGEFQKPL